jgi:hypothetical protein
MLAGFLLTAGPASAEEWKRTASFAATITNPGQYCRAARATAKLRASTFDVHVRRYRCTVNPKQGRWRPIEVYVRMSGPVVDDRGNPYTSRFVINMVDFKRHVVRLFGSDEV